jgi:hypothetical protein
MCNLIHSCKKRPNRKITQVHGSIVKLFLALLKSPSFLPVIPPTPPPLPPTYEYTPTLYQLKFPSCRRQHEPSIRGEKRILCLGLASRLYLTLKGHIHKNSLSTKYMGACLRTRIWPFWSFWLSLKMLYNPPSRVFKRLLWWVGQKRSIFIVGTGVTGEE